MVGGAFCLSRVPRVPRLRLPRALASVTQGVQRKAGLKSKKQALKASKEELPSLWLWRIRVGPHVLTMGRFGFQEGSFWEGSGRVVVLLGISPELICYGHGVFWFKCRGKTPRLDPIPGQWRFPF